MNICCLSLFSVIANWISLGFGLLFRQNKLHLKTSHSVLGSSDGPLSHFFINNVLICWKIISWFNHHENNDCISSVVWHTNNQGRNQIINSPFSLWLTSRTEYLFEWGINQFRNVNLWTLSPLRFISAGLFCTKPRLHSFTAFLKFSLISGHYSIVKVRKTWDLWITGVKFAVARWVFVSFDWRFEEQDEW